MSASDLSPATLGFWPSWAHRIGDVVCRANGGIVTAFAVAYGVGLGRWRLV
jgi:hypothetical protein